MSNIHNDDDANEVFFLSKWC